MPDAFLPPIFDKLNKTLDCLKLAPDPTIEKLVTFDELIKQLLDQDPDPVSPHYWKSFEALVAPKRLEYGHGLSVTWSTPTAPDPGKFEPPWTGQPAPGNQDFRNFFAGPTANPKPWPGRLWNPNRQVILAQVTDEINELVRNGQLSGTQREYILRFDLDGKFDPCANSELPSIGPSLQNASIYQWQPALLSQMPALYAVRDPETLTRVFSSVQDLTRDQATHVRFSNHTALVRTLRGDDLMATLDDGNRSTDAPSLVARTEELFRKHTYAFGARETLWWKGEETIGRVVRLRQTDSKGIPVYGGVFIASFEQGGRSTFVNNSCYPVGADSIADRFKLSQGDALETAKRFVAANLVNPATAVASLLAVPGDNLLVGEEAGKVIFPALRVKDTYRTEETIVDEERTDAVPIYLPAWAIDVIHEITGQSWSVIVQADVVDDDLNRRVVAWQETSEGASVTASVFLTDAHAMGLAGLGPQSLVIAETNDGTLAQADFFALAGTGVAVTQPGALVPDPIVGISRVANVYYHLIRARGWFRNVITEGWADALPGPTTPGDGVNRLSVTFTQEATDAAYGWTDVLTLGKGNSTGPHPIGDPALDAEVIYHEFAHAVLHRVQPDLHIAQNSVFRQAVDEGLAFYLACSISDAIAQTEVPAVAGAWIPYRWGKLARSSAAWANFGYRDLERWDLAPSQEADHDYLTVYGVFPRFANGTTDPDGKGYACGMLWARTLWDIRRILGHPWADAIILRGTQLAGGTQADLETPAEAIIHADAVLAHHHGVPPHESALRVIFSSRGILADSPIHAVKVVQVGQVSAILAATESALATSNDSGCLISLDGGQSWRPLGKAGPQDIVALCTLGTGNGDVLVFAAAESWTSNRQGPADRTVYRYRLSLAPGAVDLDKTWDTLPFLRTNGGMLSIAATHSTLNDATSTPWVFVGTENGIYKYDGTNWPPTPTSPSRPVTPNWVSPSVFDLQVVHFAGNRMLVAATNEGLRFFELVASVANTGAALSERADPPQPMVNGQTDFPVLSICTDAPGPGQVATHLWIGSADGDVFEMDLRAQIKTWTSVAGVWRRNGHIERPRTVFQMQAVPDLAGSFDLYAGTNNGLYRRTTGGDWQAQIQGFTPGAETLDNVSVLCLAQVGTAWLVGTGQRGLWLLDNNAWIRLSNGLSRAGHLTDQLDSSCNCFKATVPRGRAGTHVVYVPSAGPHGLTCTLALTAGGPLADIDLFHASPAINPAQNQWAGVRTCNVDRSIPNEVRLTDPVAPGYYLVVVRTGATLTSYELTVDITP